MKHSTDVKETALKKVLGGRPVPVVGAEMGINPRTLYGWVQWAKNGRMGRKRKGRGAAEKFSLVLEARTLSEEELGQWLRRNGMHESQLKAWESEILAALEHADGRGGVDAEHRERIRQLERELDRKEKALAEMSALVVLKKKPERWFGEGESAT